jgi:hypothetical protein
LNQWAQEASHPEELKNMARAQAMSEVTRVKESYAEMLQSTAGPWFLGRVGATRPRSYGLEAVAFVPGRVGVRQLQIPEIAITSTDASRAFRSLTRTRWALRSGEAVLVVMRALPGRRIVKAWSAAAGGDIPAASLPQIQKAIFG